MDQLDILKLAVNELEHRIAPGVIHVVGGDDMRSSSRRSHRHSDRRSDRRSGSHRRSTRHRSSRRSSRRVVLD